MHYVAKYSAILAWQFSHLDQMTILLYSWYDKHTKGIEQL